MSAEDLALMAEESSLSEMLRAVSTESIFSVLMDRFEDTMAKDLPKVKSREMTAAAVLDAITQIAEEMLNSLMSTTIEGQNVRLPLTVSESAVARVICQGGSSDMALVRSNQEGMTKLFGLFSREVTNVVNNVLQNSRIQNNGIVIPESNICSLQTGHIKKINLYLRHLSHKIFPCCSHNKNSEDSEDEYTILDRAETQVPAITVFRDPTESTSATNLPSTPKSTSSKVRAAKSQTMSLNRWDIQDCKLLANEVVKSLYEGQDVNENEAALDLLTQLVVRLNKLVINVPPDMYYMRKMAKSIVQELCEGKRREWVEMHIMLDNDFKASVIENICEYLEKAEKPAPTPVSAPTDVEDCKEPILAPALNGTSSARRTAPSKSDAKSKKHSLYTWDKQDCQLLAYEVFACLYKGQNVNTIDKAKEIMAQLEARLSELDIQVSPDIPTVWKLAESIVHDLCRDGKREWVALQLLVDDNFKARVLDNICEYLERPSTPRVPAATFSQDPIEPTSIIPLNKTASPKRLTSKHRIASSQSATKSKKPSLYTWTTEDSKLLAYEVARHLYKGKNVSKKDMARIILEPLMTRLDELNIQVPSDVYSIKTLAKSIVQDLCKGKVREWVGLHLKLDCAFKASVIDKICEQLETPQTTGCFTSLKKMLYQTFSKRCPDY